MSYFPPSKAVILIVDGNKEDFCVETSSNVFSNGDFITKFGISGGLVAQFNQNETQSQILSQFFTQFIIPLDKVKR